MTAAVTPLHKLGEWMDLVKDLSLLRSLSELDLHHLDESGLLYSVLKLWLDNFGVTVGTLQFCVDGGLQEGATLRRDPAQHYVAQPLIETPYHAMLSGICAELGGEEVSIRCPTGTDGIACGAALVLPLRSEEGLLGVLCLFHESADHFDLRHERLGVPFANFLSQMIQSGRLLRQMQSEVALRVAANDRLMRETLELKREFERLSFVDDLTQLYNRRFFMQEAKRALAKDIQDGQPFTLMLLDLDYFKRINDRFGHAAGDEVLQCVSAYLKSRVRKGDILSRFGGEEFVLALPGTDCEGAKRVGESLLAGVRTLTCLRSQRKARITMSIGIAGRESILSADFESNLDHLFHNADMALYAAKQSGRDCLCVYEETGVCYL